ncbi:hypothetical protein KI387_008740, partial [Taxus chinensis]
FTPTDVQVKLHWKEGNMFKCRFVPVPCHEPSSFFFFLLLCIWTFLSPGTFSLPLGCCVDAGFDMVARWSFEPVKQACV